jgi:peptidoglycan/LPS O-acetylase OafA/YrhL
VRALDGLRGVAVLMVVADHAGFAGQGQGGMGASGVTIFFVLSGYLITRIVLADRERGDWSMRRFLAARAVRLVPALALMVAAAVAAWLAIGGARDGLALEIVAALTYTKNIAFMHFDAGLFRHTWSLAVEEQFYLLWPLVLPLVVKLRRPILWLGLVIVASIALRIAVAAMAGAYASYPSLPTNAFALLMGCCLAIRPTRVAPGPVQRAVPVVVLAALLWFVVATGSPAAFVLVPVPVSLMAVVVLVWSLPGVPVLEVAWLRFVGRISYSLYLWHWPALLIADEKYGGLSALPVLILAGAAATGSTLLVEEPLRRRWRAVRAPAATRA